MLWCLIVLISAGHRKLTQSLHGYSYHFTTCFLFSNDPVWYLVPKLFEIPFNRKFTLALRGVVLLSQCRNGNEGEASRLLRVLFATGTRPSALVRRDSMLFVLQLKKTILKRKINTRKSTNEIDRKSLFRIDTGRALMEFSELIFGVRFMLEWDLSIF